MADEQQRRLDEWRALPREERHKRVTDAFDALTKASESESQAVFREIQFRVSAEGVALVRELADLSVSALEDDRIEDREVEAEARRVDDPREFFISFWGSPYQRLMHSLLNANLDGDEMAMRLWVVYTRWPSSRSSCWRRMAGQRTSPL